MQFKLPKVIPHRVSGVTFHVKSNYSGLMNQQLTSDFPEKTPKN
jgi:hypothetical protein